MAISISLPWVSTTKHPHKGHGCDKKNSVKQLMSLSIIALVPIDRICRSKLLQRKLTGLVTHVCSQVLGTHSSVKPHCKITIQRFYSETANDCSNKNIISYKLVFIKERKAAR